MRISRRLVHVILALCLALPFVAVLPATSSAACSSARITLYENPNYGSDGGTQPFVTTCDDSYLGDNLAVPGDGCSAPLLNRGDWNDCVSSWKVTTPAASGGCYHYGITLYINSNYNTVLWSTWGPKNFSGGFGFEDVLSSFKFKYRSTCPSFAEQAPS